MSVPPRPSRDQLRKAGQPYAAALGELIIAWNDLHETLSFLFELAIKSSSRQMGISIWHSTENDYAQRKMLRAAVEQATHFTEDQREDMLWVLDRIDNTLRHSRNDMIHSPVSFIQGLTDEGPSDESIVVVPGTSDNPRAKALWARAARPGAKALWTTVGNLKSHFDETRRLAEVLDDFAMDMFRTILNPSEWSWPKRPALPQAHRKKGGKD
jgi:hypothetical protein